MEVWKQEHFEVTEMTSEESGFEFRLADSRALTCTTLLLGIEALQLLCQEKDVRVFVGGVRLACLGQGLVSDRVI